MKITRYYKAALVAGTAMLVIAIGTTISQPSNDEMNKIDPKPAETEQEYEVENTNTLPPVEASTETAIVTKPAPVQMPAAPVEDPKPTPLVDPIDAAIEFVYGGFDTSIKSEGARCLKMIRNKRPEAFASENTQQIVQSYISMYQFSGICAVAERI